MFSTLLLLSACAHRAPVPDITKDGWAEGTAPRCDPAEWPEGERDPMLAIQRRGLLLAARDRLGWEATDRMVEHVPPELVRLVEQGARVGYVIDTADPARPRVSFVALDAEQALALLHVEFDANNPQGRAVPVEPPEPLPETSSLVRRARALDSAMADPGFVKKAPSYNPDVLPWSDDPAEGWAVYLVPGAQTYDHVPLGGGYLAHVSEDGAQVLELTPLSQTVLDVSVTALQADPSALFITSVLTERPDATYVSFSNIWQVRMAVVTPSHGWLISGADLCWVPKG